MKTNRCTKLCKRRLLPFLLLTVLFLSLSLRAQVTVGSSIPPTRAALLDIKARQKSGSISSVLSDDNITSAEGDGGLLLPRVMLVNIYTLEPFIEADDPEFVKNTNSLKEKYAGLMVYNLRAKKTGDPEDTPTRRGVYIWDGAKWEKKYVNKVVPKIIKQPKPFTFYETGFETAEKLSIEVGGEGVWEYQWYYVTGKNKQVRIGEKIPGETSKELIPKGKINSSFSNLPGGTTTRHASVAGGYSRVGLYSYYCVTTNGIDTLTSNIAEVAIGCGAKNNAGEWLSFMCFNLGADNVTTDYTTISNQKSSNLSTSTLADQEKIWGHLFQWGRIADGQQLRTSISVPGPITTTYLATGNKCNSTDIGRPSNQVSKNATTYYGKFITGSSNWVDIIEDNANTLWITSRFLHNDPCARYEFEGTRQSPGIGKYHNFWHEGTTETHIGTDVCNEKLESDLNWRTPTQDEWASIFKGGTTSAIPGDATANTWKWYNGVSNKGYEIKPDGVTTTLFLPAGGYREGSTGSFLETNTSGHYWSVTIMSSNTSFYMNFDASKVDPAAVQTRANGLSLRCIKN